MENISKYSNIPQNELDKIDKKSLQDLEYILCEIEKPHSGLPDILSNNPRLVISPSNMCDKNCLHCISDSKFNGEMMEYDKFESIPIDFLELFSYVDFGRTGDPMLYNYEGKNLSDVISFLTGAGIENYTIAAGLFLNPKSEEPIPKIKETKEEKNLKMDNMLTFSNYYGMDESRLIEVFINYLKSQIQFP